MTIGYNPRYIPAVIAYLGARSACFEVREVFLFGLFAPTVLAAPLAPVLDALNALGRQLALFEGSPAHRQQVAHSIARWSFFVLLRVFVHGGRTRSFIMSEAPLLYGAIFDLKQLFVGWGVEDAAIVRMESVRAARGV